MVRTFTPVSPPLPELEDNEEVRRSWNTGTKVMYLTEDSERWVEAVVEEVEHDTNDELWLEIRLSNPNIVEEVFAFDECVKPFSERFPITHTLEQVKEKYEFMKKLGHGATSLVRLVKRRSDGKLFALKQIKKKRLDLDEQAQVEKEIVFLQHASHPNIVEIEECLTTKSFICVILEYVSGGHLFDRITQKGSFSEFEAATIMKQILSALAYMHAADYCHRDVKPLNLMIRDDDMDCLDMCLIDFGFLGHTTKGLSTILGSPQFLAPEVIAEKPYSKKIDVWSCGIVLYMLLYGRVPFQANGSVPKLFKSIINDPVPHPKNSGLSKAAHKVLERMLEKDPEKRASCAEVMNMDWFYTASPTFLSSTHSKNMSTEDISKLENFPWWPAFSTAFR